MRTRLELERRLALANRAFERGFEIGVLVDAAHAASAAARRRLDQDRIADRVSLLLEEFRILALTVIAGHNRHSRFFHQRLGAILQPHGADGSRRRADENEPGLRASLCEIGVFGQEPVARMNTVGRGFFRDIDQPFDGEITVAWLGAADEMRLVA